MAAASSRFNPRPPVIGQLLRGKKSTPWQPDKPIKSPASVTAATLQAEVGWAEEQSGHYAQVHSLGVDSNCQPPRSGYTDVHHRVHALTLCPLVGLEDEEKVEEKEEEGEEKEERYIEEWKSFWREFQAKSSQSLRYCKLKTPCA